MQFEVRDIEIEVSEEYALCRHSSIVYDWGKVYTNPSDVLYGLVVRVLLGFGRDAFHKEKAMRITDLRWMMVAPVLLSFAAHANGECSNATLSGKYTFTITGQILAPAPAAGPVAGVALTDFFGDGALRQVDHVVHNGVLPLEAWRPGTGSYHVNDDCTGWMILTAEPTNPADNSPQLKLYIVVSEDGHEVRTVVSGSPTVPVFTADITSIGVRSDF